MVWQIAEFQSLALNERAGVFFDAIRNALAFSRTLNMYETKKKKLPPCIKLANAVIY